MKCTDHFEYDERQSGEISFPLGGIGAGCIGLAGNGRLIDWEIFNRPNKGSLNGMSHFAVRAEHDGDVVDARVLQGDLPPPYTGETAGAAFNSGFGWGPKRENLAGMPHFRQHCFTGEFPLADVTFGGETTFPGEVTLHAWSPFIPGNPDDSGLPGAFFEIVLTNTTRRTVTYTVVGALSNPFSGDVPVNSVKNTDGITSLTVHNAALEENDGDSGDLSLSTDATDVSYQEYWYRGQWCDSLEVFWNDFMSGGKFQNRTYDAGQQNCWEKRDTGHLAAHVDVAPSQTRRLRFVITWNVPHCRNYWREGDRDFRERLDVNNLENHWVNWYCTRWDNSRASAHYGLQEYERLHGETGKFHDGLFGSTLPRDVIDAVSANLSILKSPTCLRLEDGTFYGWEGVAMDHGSCEGSCAHVWNYAQALAFLFPQLERSMRDATYTYGVDRNGGNHFRLHLPLGIQARAEDHRPCPDGQFGDVLKTYRDWKICGDTPWLKKLWPALRQTVQYAWSEYNPDRWDPHETGVLHGRQHHTLDMELFGPNAWLSGFYIASLKAAAEMAEACDEPAFAQKCRRLSDRGKEWVEQHLFNGRWYVQKINLSDCEMLESYPDAVDVYWDEEHGQIKYQIGDGINVDMTTAQWHADLYGLGEILNTEQVQSHLRQLFGHNFCRSRRHGYNPWRVFSVNDEAGMQMCIWPPECDRPAIPLPYSQETMNGFEYTVACQLIRHGMVEEGIEMVRAIRDRYDGEKRNPWNEIECGSNYARSMASYALLHAFSGFQFDRRTGYMSFDPVVGGSGRYMWSLGDAWGVIDYAADGVELEVKQGKLALNDLDLSVIPRRVTVDGEITEWRKDGTHVIFPETVQIEQCVKVGFEQQTGERENPPRRERSTESVSF